MLKVVVFVVMYLIYYVCVYVCIYYEYYYIMFIYIYCTDYSKYVFRSGKWQKYSILN